MSIQFFESDIYRQMFQQMRDELTQVGFKELLTADEVKANLDNAQGTTLVFVNSVCGCAGGIARPGVAKAIQHSIRPDHLVTVFAGQDKEATAEARTYFVGYPPSSPSMALLKDGKLVYMMERHQIEGRDTDAVAGDLIRAFEQYCG
ncbi:BrxA/BrxB family bacilliredoxin [Fodinisporobacter ferrooxydans]|uniref:BrxA/BrxB family bacilliredoxin n=1 Tax=Fodinisporobacter ferrooxydans TaxID=2901836 RepID=A0ABY4CP53_9BACL|nr:BrxA/BrxB family bacilliredoxin [Alicyclobacillaceae bacterium MYW30-H2]